MVKFDKKFLLCAFAYAIVGMSVGVYMGASTDHKQLVSHAHILLVGFVVSFIYALVHKLWITDTAGPVASIQFYLHQLATICMCSSLLLLYGGILPEPTLGPILGMSSVGVLLSAILMAYMILRSSGNKN